jgi:hypothetical protein
MRSAWMRDVAMQNTDFLDMGFPGLICLIVPAGKRNGGVYPLLGGKTGDGPTSFRHRFQKGRSSGHS